MHNTTQILDDAEFLADAMTSVRPLSESIKKYFFAKDGWQTVDENYIKPPMQVSGS
jgi:hypothetical protein